jgi:hypothetical protein
MDVLTSETCWALNNEIIKQVTSSWSIFIQLRDEVPSPTDVQRQYLAEIAPTLQQVAPLHLQCLLSTSLSTILFSQSSSQLPLCYQKFALYQNTASSACRRAQQYISVHLYRLSEQCSILLQANSYLYNISLTFWRRNYFFNSSTPVYKMWIIQEPNTL